MEEQVANSRKREKNKQFLILQAIAICLMVIGHKVGDSYFMSFVGQWFNIYGYHMALFIFVSGYFFKQKSIENIPFFIWQKIKKLIIPYFIWNLVYAVILFLLTKYEVANYVQPEYVFTFTNLFIAPWINGEQYIFNLASWFVLILFITHVLYILIRWLYEKLRFNNEWILQIFLLFIGLFALYYVRTTSVIADFYKPFLKVFFFLPFYHFGFYYKSKLESKYSVQNGWYFFILLAILYFVGIQFPASCYSVLSLYFQNNVFLPFLTSFVGILFWLRVSKNIYNVIGSNKLIEYLGANTWSVMMHHLFVFFLINWLLYSLNIEGFDEVAWRGDPWYSLPVLPVFLYWIIAILLSLLWQYSFDKGKVFLRNSYNNLKRE